LTDAGLRIAVVGVPGQGSTEALATALEDRTGFRQVVDFGTVAFDSTRGTIVHGDVDLCGLDALAVKKLGETYHPSMQDRIELLDYIAAAGVQVYSRPGSLRRVVDRLSGTLVLQHAGIPIPPTVVTEECMAAVHAVERFGAAILKPLYTTKARGMRLLIADGRTDLETEIRAFQSIAGPFLYVQKQVELPERDLGVAFLGGRYLGTYARVRGGRAWNTTIRAGGRYERHDPAPQTIELAHRAQALFGLEFTTVDVAETPSGPVVFEVSAFGGFRGLQDGLGIDAASCFADHLVQRVRERGARARDPVPHA
jgi:tetrahydromethanopterin:alpha-L-glutamate ligase